MHSLLNNINCSGPLLALIPGAEPSMINKVGVGKCLESKCLCSCSIPNKTRGQKWKQESGLRDVLGSGAMAGMAS